MSYPVTQADREAAALALGYKDWEDATDYRLTADQDHAVAHFVQSFAKHRIEALDAAKGAVRAAHAYDDGTWQFSSDPHAFPNACCAAIEALKGNS